MITQENEPWLIVEPGDTEERIEQTWEEYGKE